MRLRARYIWRAAAVVCAVLCVQLYLSHSLVSSGRGDEFVEDNVRVKPTQQFNLSMGHLSFDFLDTNYSFTDVVFPEGLCAEPVESRERVRPVRPEPPESTRLVLQYNILNGAREPLRRKRIGDWIYMNRVDVVGLNELKHWTKETMAEVANEWGFEYYSIVESVSEWSIGILSQRPITEHCLEPGGVYSRGLLHVEIEEVHYFVTHLSPFSSTERLGEVNDIVTRISQLPKHSRAVVMGDMNTLSPLDEDEHFRVSLARTLSADPSLAAKFVVNGSINYAPMQAFLDAGLSDVHCLTHSQCGLSRLGTVPTQIDLDVMHAAVMRLDFFLANKVFVKELRPRASIVSGPCAGILSDHFPILLELHLDAKESIQEEEHWVGDQLSSIYYCKELVCQWEAARADFLTNLQNQPANMHSIYGKMWEAEQKTSPFGFPWVVRQSEKGQPCTSVCEGERSFCDSSLLSEINNCERLKSEFPCVHGCGSNVGQDLPAYVDAHGTDSSNRCLTSLEEGSFSCDASHSATMRLCPCVTLPEGVEVTRVPTTQGGTCDDACTRAGEEPGSLACADFMFFAINTCEVLQATFPCSGCMAMRGGELPAYVTDEENGNYDQCLVKQVGPETTPYSCETSHPSTTRLCPCIPAQFVYTYESY